MKNRRLFKPFVLLMLLHLAIQTSAQKTQNRRCGTDEVLQQWLNEDPANKTRYEEFNREIQTTIQSTRSKSSAASKPTYLIPVVVHVIYNTAAENISDAQIMTQMAVINEDFRRMNADQVNTPAAFASVAADAGIQFCLAKVDPNGNTTTGITRDFTNMTSFHSITNNAALKNINNWDTKKYLNIWVCNLSDRLGYSPPIVNGIIGTWNDGIVVKYDVFGTIPPLAWGYDLGRTTTHEIGHWLGLHHTFGPAGSPNCSDDMISDTPIQETSNGGCPAFPHISGANCQTGTNGPNGDMFMNYMDYTNDVCMNLFTAGQVTKMQTILSTVRSSLLTGYGCCFNHVNVTTNVTTTDEQEAIQSVAAFNQIASGASAKYHGGTSVTLKTGFHAAAGCYFHGYLDGCNNYFWKSHGGSTEPITSTPDNNLTGNTASDESSVRIWPNPVEDFVQLEVTGNGKADVTYTLTDLLGKNVISQTHVDTGKMQFSISEFPAGVYFLKTDNGSSTTVHKIIKR